MFRHLVFFFLGLVFIYQSATAQVSDDFADGNFTSSPNWLGDTGSWRVVAQQLNSNAPAANTQTYLATANTLAVNSQWEFFVNLKFATSSANYADIFLISDSLSLSGQNSGYFVRVGNTLDEICLYRKTGGTSVKIIDGIDSRVGSTNNLFKIKVTRSGTCEFKLYDDSTGTGNNYILEGSITDNKYLYSSYFGFLLKYSSANVQKFYFDDIQVGSLKTDTESIRVDSDWAVDSVTCYVQCSEAVLDADASNTGNYMLNGAFQPSTAQRLSTDFSLIRLTFATPFTPNVLQNLQIYNLRDLVLNMQKGIAVKTFTFNRNAYGDLLINEIFADPSPVIGLPAYEYVELWNVSGKDLNLSGYTLTDGSSTALFPSIVLKKDSFLIVCGTTAQAAFAVYGQTLGVTGFPSLNNDADDLRLYDDKNLLINQQKYNLSWYHDAVKSDGGWSLEMINPSAQCRLGFNWNASVNSTGGTPGQPNSVYNAFADTLSPRVTMVSRTSDSSLLVLFNDAMDSSSVKAMSVSVTGMVVKSIKTISILSDSAVITFTTSFVNQTNYSVQFASARNCLSKAMLPYQSAFYYEIPRAARTGDVVISEILADPDPSVGLGSSEFIEIHNRAAYAINLKGMQITDGSSTALLPDYILYRDSFLILTSTTGVTWFTQRGIAARAVSGMPSLDNAGDRLILKDSTGQLIHYMAYILADYSEPAKTAGGWSLELKDENQPCLVNGNWQFSTDASGGTPGRKNSVRGSINAPPIALKEASTPDPFHAVITFSVPVDSALPAAAFEFSPALKGGFSVTYYQSTPNALLLTFSSPLDSGIIYNLKIKNVINCSSSRLNEANVKFGVPYLPQRNDLVINEILFDAWPYGSEFVELYNRSSRIIELSGLALGNYTSSGALHDVLPITTTPKQLLPGAYFVLSEMPDDVLKRYEPIASHGELYALKNWSSLDDDSGAVFIQSISNNTMIDSIGYAKAMHHPFLGSKEGVSLERVDYDADGQNRFNWQSAASAVRYATPGYQNSKFSKAMSSDDFVTIPVAYLSPDNDGTNDDLKIYLHLPAGQFTASITIYSASGNRVRRLVNNEIAATDAVYSWDGSTDTGGLAPVGHYVVFIETLSTTGESRSVKKVIDLLMR